MSRSPMSGIAARLAGVVAFATAQPSQAAAHAAAGSFPIVELRQYTLHDGRRDELIDLFEREFVESQEALGMKVIGTFVDLDRPNRFVWLRGFHNMGDRVAASQPFTEGQCGKPIVRRPTPP